MATKKAKTKKSPKRSRKATTQRPRKRITLWLDGDLYQAIKIRYGEKYLRNAVEYHLSEAYQDDECTSPSAIP
jgi:hypothetical protein